MVIRMKGIDATYVVDEKTHANALARVSSKISSGVLDTPDLSEFRRNGQKVRLPFLVPKARVLRFEKSSSDWPMC